MRVVVALGDHYLRTPGGEAYSKSVLDYAFWRRYLDVFDEVLVFARMAETTEPIEDRSKSSGSGVSFSPLPDFHGPLQYLKVRKELLVRARQMLKTNDAYILRVPGTVGTVLWREVLKANRPYGVEVVGDPWDSLSPGSVKTVLRPILRRKIRWELTRQCRLADAVSYVTEYSLQQRYPPGRWSTHCSDVQLSNETIIDASAIETRIKSIEAKGITKGPWRICYAGTMAQLYKAPDVLIDAVSQCIAGGLDLELIMLGDGQYRSQLQEQAERLGIGDKVKFLGMLPAGRTVYEQFDKADLYVLPSRQEGLPRSVIEAMARGLPCITSNVGGLPELMEREYMVNPNNMSALSSKIAAAVSDVDGMKNAVRRNVKVAAKYRSDVLQQKRVEFFTKIKEVTLAWLEQKNR